MKTCWSLSIAAVLTCVQCVALAQQPTSPAPLSSEQREGRRIFQQKCALCHLPVVSSGGQPYARRLSRAVVERNVDAARKMIENGNPRMPGWKYTLRAEQIDHLIQYLKTVDTPISTVSAQATEF